MTICFYTIPFKLIAATISILLALIPAQIGWSATSEVGIVTANRLNMRPDPGKGRPPLKTLRKGTKVSIRSHCNGWLEILHEGQVGYIKNKRQYVYILKRTEIEGNHEGDIARLKKEATSIAREIETRHTDVKKYNRKETTLINSLNEIDLTLNRARKRVLDLKSELAGLEKEIADTTGAINDLIEQIKINEDYVERRLVALYKLNRLGKMHFLASTESLYGFFQRKAALQRILTYDDNTMKSLAGKKAALQSLLDTLNARKIQRHAIEADLKKQIGVKSRKRAERANLLTHIRNQRALEKRVIESLKQAARDLDHEIESLTRDVNASRTEKRISSKALSAYKGLLAMPVKGKVISLFGPHKNAKFNVVNFQSGIDIKAERGEPIRAVCEGRVIYATWFKGYGNMIIIDHGNNYCTVYAHAEELFKTKGDHVEAGEVIATVGDTGSMIGSQLHFELRHHGKPIDPLKWFKKG